MSSLNSVNLDSMIPRADLALLGDDAGSVENQSSIGVRDLIQGSSLILPSLRKPDFQRETNHWVPDQIVALIQSFIDGDLIPAVILWRSNKYVFVIDGGHRLSALRAWVLDDYGDGFLSQKLFGNDINQNQKKVAERTRRLVKKAVGTYAYWKELNENNEGIQISAQEQQRLKHFTTRVIPIQWVPGDVDKAEHSFFKINTKGTPLDEVEETLIRNRKKPIAIVARSIIRAGQGHKYWSAYAEEIKEKIESYSFNVNKLLFEPEVKDGVKTIDLPLGGAAGVRTALKLLMELSLVASKNGEGKPHSIEDQDDDVSGDETVELLKKITKLVKRITGNDAPSLGLHPAVYFYNHTGRYAPSMFMGIVILFANKIANNDKGFFKKFTDSRKDLEDFIINNKVVLSSISLQLRSKIRNEKISELFEKMILEINENGSINADKVIDMAGFTGTSLQEKVDVSVSSFSAETKSAVFVKNAIEKAMTCAVCGGKITPTSMSYDHIVRKQDGGLNSDDNCQILHPFCNSGVKS